MTHSATKKKLRPLQLAAVIFFTVSGGPYGLEPLLMQAGNLSLVLLLAVPVLWDIPSILTVLELNSMMPVTGGYYKWVKYALGTRWGFYEGMWTWFYTFVDLAIYPVLFVQYATYLFPQLESVRIPICMAVIWSSAVINILGIVQVGRMSFLLSCGVVAPFVMLVVVYLFHAHAAASYAVVPHHTFSSVGLAAFTVMWNFFGWDNVTTYAEEVENPVRAYLVSIVIAFVSVAGIYFAVAFVALHSGLDPKVLAEDGFPALGGAIAGRWLGVLIACGGMASALGLFNANLLSVSRVPKAMADDKLLPEWLSTVHPRLGTPYVSILLCAAVVSVMSLFSFGDLLIADVTIYGAGLFLEYFALIRLRVTQPDMPRPFRIPLGTAGLCLLISVPIIVYTVALTGVCRSAGNAWIPASLALGVLIFTIIVWEIIVRVRRQQP